MKTPPFKIGDKVYYRGPADNDVVRTITDKYTTKYDTGWRYNVDGGELCPACGKLPACPQYHVSHKQLIRVESEQ